MKKLFAILAVGTILVACNNSPETSAAAADSSKMAPAADSSKMAPADSSKMTVADSSKKTAADSSKMKTDSTAAKKK